RFTLQVEQGLTRYPGGRYKDHAGFVTTPEEAARLSEFYGMDIQPWKAFAVDNISQLFETGHAQVYSLSATGGSENITYFVSGRYADEDGPFGAEDWGPARDDDRKTQANANLTIRPWEQVRFDVNTMYTESFHETPPNNNNTMGVISQAISSKPELASPSNLTGVYATGTTREMMYRRFQQEVQRFAGSVAANYRPTESISLDASFGVDMVNQQDVGFSPFGWNVHRYASSAVQGTRTVSARNHRVGTLDLKA